jgi:hypothetical protein
MELSIPREVTEDGIVRTTGEHPGPNGLPDFTNHILFEQAK